MADTVITNTPSRSDDSGALGWVVALIVILAVIVAGFVWVRRDVGVPNTGSGAGANINVTLPSGGTDGSGATGGTGATQ